MKIITKNGRSKAKSFKPRKKFYDDKLLDLIYDLLINKYPKLFFSREQYAEMLGGCTVKTISRSFKKFRINNPELIISDPEKRSGSYKNKPLTIEFSKLSPLYEQSQKNVPPIISLKRSVRDTNSSILSVSIRESLTKKISTMKRGWLTSQLVNLLSLTPKQATHFSAYPLSCLKFALKVMRKMKNWARHLFAYTKNVMENWMMKRKRIPSYKLMFESQSNLTQDEISHPSTIQTITRTIKEFLWPEFDCDEQKRLQQFFEKQEQLHAKQLATSVGWIDKPELEDVIWDYDERE